MAELQGSWIFYIWQFFLHIKQAASSQGHNKPSVLFQRWNLYANLQNKEYFIIYTKYTVTQNN